MAQGLLRSQFHNTREHLCSPRPIFLAIENRSERCVGFDGIWLEAQQLLERGNRLRIRFQFRVGLAQQVSIIGVAWLRFG